MAKKQRKKRKPQLLRSKKGFVFADVVGAFQRGVSWLLSSAPKPLLFVIFLLFLIAFSAVFGFLLNATGNFCDAQGNKYTTGVFSLITNFELLSDMPKTEDLGKQQLPADESIFLIAPKCQKRFTDPYYYNDNGDKVYLSTGSGYYYDGSLCTKCNAEEIYSNITADSGKYCTGDVYPLAHDDKSWIQKTFCGGSACEPPTGYFYDQSENSYVCTANCNGTTVGQRWNELLLSRGAKPSVSNANSKSYLNAVTVSCDAGDINPRFKFFGIQIFDYKLWIVIFLLTIAVWAMYKLKK